MIFAKLNVIGIVRARVGNMLIKNEDGLVVQSNLTAVQRHRWRSRWTAKLIVGKV
jgi:hypothetical protein